MSRDKTKKELGAEFPVDQFVEGVEGTAPRAPMAPSATIATATVAADDTFEEPAQEQTELNFDEPPQEEPSATLSYKGSL